jgi:hypothetical protein
VVDEDYFNNGAKKHIISLDKEEIILHIDTTNEKE